MRCAICNEELRDEEHIERWGPEFAHTNCVKAFNDGKAAQGEQWGALAQEIDSGIKHGWPQETLSRLGNLRAAMLQREA